MIGSWGSIMSPCVGESWRVNAKGPELSPGPVRYSVVEWSEDLAAQEGHDSRTRLVGLRQDGLASLLQDTRLGEVDHFSRHVYVADAALGGGQVRLRDAEVGNGVLEAVLVGAQRRSLR